MKRILYLELFVFITLIPFQDSGLQGTPFRFMGASLSTFPLLLILLTIFVQWIFRRRATIKYSLIGIMVYAMALNLGYMLVGPTESHGELIATRALKLALVNILFLAPIFCVRYEEFDLTLAIRIAFILTCVGVLLLVAVPALDANAVIHFHENGNMRPRGFSMEASTLSVCLGAMGLLVARTAESSLGKAVVFGVTGLMLLMSSSKGGLIAFAVSGILCLILAPGLNFLKKSAITALALLAAVGMLQLAASWFRTDISDYTSVASRTVLIGTSIETVSHRPLGVGYSGFLPAVDRFGPDAAQAIASAASVALNLSEVETYFGSRSAENVSSKTFLFDNLMYFGIPFAICFIVFNYRLIACLRRQREWSVLFALLFVAIAVSTYSGGVAQYNISLVYGVAFAIYRQKHFSCVA